MRVVVYHRSYGCDTGCCGHVVEIDDGIDDGQDVWTFDHPYGNDPKEFAETLVRETFGEDHVTDLDWDNCVISDE